MINQNPEWQFWLPDNIADWDAITGWEEERLASMQQHLHPGMTLYDVGTEHGWLTAVYGSFTGHENLVLIEPSPEMWINIRKIWSANKLPDPIASVQAFMGEVVDPLNALLEVWPACSVGFEDADEVPGMAYRYIGDDNGIKTYSIDQLVADGLPIPDALTIDVEGFELSVLRGAEVTLREQRPLVWASVHPDLMQRHCGIESVQELFDFMTSLDYGREYLGTDHEQHDLFAPLEWSPR